MLEVRAERLSLSISSDMAPGNHTKINLLRLGLAAPFLIIMGAVLAEAWIPQGASAWTQVNNGAPFLLMGCPSDTGHVNTKLSLWGPAMFLNSGMTGISGGIFPTMQDCLVHCKNIQHPFHPSFKQLKPHSLC